MIRLLSFLGIILLALLAAPVWALPLAIWHIFRFSAYELLGLAVCVDVYFGAGQWPYYTLSTIGLLLGVAWLRPQMSFFNTV